MPPLEKTDVPALSTATPPIYQRLGRWDEDKALSVEATCAHGLPGVSVSQMARKKSKDSPIEGADTQAVSRYQRQRSARGHTPKSPLAPMRPDTAARLDMVM